MKTRSFLELSSSKVIKTCLLYWCVWSRWEYNTIVWVVGLLHYIYFLHFHCNEDIFSHFLLVLFVCFLIEKAEFPTVYIDMSVSCSTDRY